ncbi:hypothetical protein ACHAPJ_002380 [Fusarium lateritium]
MGYYPEPARIDLRVVMPNHDDYLLHHIPLRSSDEGVNAMLKLMRALKASRGRLANWLMKVVPLPAPVVYTATLYPSISYARRDQAHPESSTSGT